ncbi:hypothetical protein FA15DRAFT_603730 [Coprinopsis marcescibilis]|uniref:HAT C-terminal dimerisation domain-containing protein n=1 Tax=Coprinopsis marcescibilis TaxID=230819 RepID=A0A5C3KEH0_COPMA|nr:hypothetical protein FA15DRAFT_603730 [Coprinopsis marcescibilis]
MVDKYTVFTEECEIYYITIVMCPNRKIEWFKNRGFTQQQVKQIQMLVLKRWTESFQDTVSIPASTAHNEESRRRGWLKKADEPTTSTTPYDHITTYLKEPLVASNVITAAGGYTKWWHMSQSNRPTISKMALTYVTTPGKCLFTSTERSFIPFVASSIDAERAFSIGRRQINFMQHNMSSTSFRGKMASGSWSGTPLDPGIAAAAKVIHDSISPRPKATAQSDSESESDA